MRVEDIDKSQGYFTSTVALVTAKFGDIVNVMSAEWSLRVSLDPFLMAVFVGYERETYKLIHNSGEYGLSYCTDKQGTLAHIAGNYSLSNHNKFELANFKTFTAKHIKAPLIDECISNFECEVIDEFKVGDHAAFIGKVLAGYYDGERKPLVFHNGKFSHIGAKVEHD
ncbi:flavin reductase domain protein FMN-binding protein [mine drainage metagenome]|uniref:Flavin reductase domain protein FMN-binding protein n=1 Tax=mine drainage metagenome TaxID=410659 RepID=T1B790_9ZZZZ